MKKIFNKKYIINSEKELIDIFCDNTLRLYKNSNIVVEGEIIIESNTTFKGLNYIKSGNRINSNCVFENVKLGNNNLVRENSLISDSNIRNNNVIGPFCFIRDNTIIKNNCIIGAYVELTRSYVNDGSSASHRAFIGDVRIGKNTIIGAGTVFCNYNFKSKKKESSVVGSKCLIGSNTTIISPVLIKSKSLIPAASVVKKNYKYLKKKND